MIKQKLKFPYDFKKWSPYTLSYSINTKLQSTKWNSRENQYSEKPFDKWPSYGIWAGACAGIIFSSLALQQISGSSLKKTFLMDHNVYIYSKIVNNDTKFSFDYLKYLRASQYINILCDVPKKVDSNNLYKIPSKPRQSNEKFKNIQISAKQVASNWPIEDRFCISKVNSNNQEVIVASVIDGHSGWLAAEFICNNITNFIIKAFENINSTFEESLINNFHALDNSLETFLNENSKTPAKGGACCLSVIIDEQFITIANTGDCMAVLSRNSEVIEMNKIHNADCPLERKKILELHPNEEDAVHCKKSWVEPKVPSSITEKALDFIGKLGNETYYSSCYVKKSLNPTRSFGDFFLKDEKYVFDKARGKYRLSKPFSFPYITSTPEVNSFKRTDGDEFIIISSDGLWDYLTSEQAAEIVKKEITISTKNATEKLIEAAYTNACEKSGLSFEELSTHPRKRAYIDDLTIIVISLKPSKDI